MRRRSWFRLGLRGAAVAVIAVSAFVLLIHAAHHLDGYGDCPVCLQGHGCHAPLPAGVQPLDAPAPLANLHPTAIEILIHDLQGSPFSGRAPPALLA
jgi:hypothetical protein